MVKDKRGISEPQTAHWIDEYVGKVQRRVVVNGDGSEIVENDVQFAQVYATGAPNHTLNMRVSQIDNVITLLEALKEDAGKEA